MQDRCKGETDRPVIITRALVVQSRADLARLQRGLATTQAIIDAMMQDLEAWHRQCVADEEGRSDRNDRNIERIRSTQ